MIATITRQYGFEAAHYLPQTHRNHRCHRMHGHNFKVTVEVTGTVDEDVGWVVDFSVIDDMFAGVIHRPLDHRTLNDIEGLTNPTSENIARWVWERMWERSGALRMTGEWPEGCAVSRVVVWEIDGFAVSYTGAS